MATEKSSFNDMKAIFLILLLSLSTSCFSQDSTANKHPPIYFKAFAGWKQDGHRLNAKALKTELYKVPDAIPFYTKSIKRNLIGLGLLAPTVVFALLSEQNTDISSPGFGKNKRGYILAGIVTSIGSIYFQISSMKQMKKAVGLYNKNQKVIY